MNFKIKQLARKNRKKKQLLHSAHIKYSLHNIRVSDVYVPTNIDEIIASKLVFFQQRMTINYTSNRNIIVCYRTK